MGILNRIFGGRQIPENEIRKEQRSPRTDPSHPDHFKRYWTNQKTDWSSVSKIRVDDTRVYAIFDVEGDCVEELVATRNDHRTASGYAKCVIANRGSLNKPLNITLELNP